MPAQNLQQAAAQIVQSLLGLSEIQDLIHKAVSTGVQGRGAQDPADQFDYTDSDALHISQSPAVEEFLHSNLIPMIKDAIKHNIDAQIAQQLQRRGAVKSDKGIKMSTTKKTAVDQATKDYWSTYFGDYGKQWVKDVPRRVKSAILRSKTAQLEGMEDERTQFELETFVLSEPEIQGRVEEIKKQLAEERQQGKFDMNRAVGMWKALVSDASRMWEIQHADEARGQKVTPDLIDHVSQELAKKAHLRTAGGNFDVVPMGHKITHDRVVLEGLARLSGKTAHIFSAEFDHTGKLLNITTRKAPVK